MLLLIARTTLSNYNNSLGLAMWNFTHLDRLNCVLPSLLPTDPNTRHSSGLLLTALHVTG